MVKVLGFKKNKEDLKQLNMLESKILGIMLSLDYESFTIKELCTLTNSKKVAVDIAIGKLLKTEKIKGIKKFRVNK